MTRTAPRVGMTEAGDGRPQVGAGVLVGGVGPEGARHPLAGHRLVSYGQEREESL